MQGEITRIDVLKESRNRDSSFRRITFKVNGKYAKTDVVSRYRNYKNWNGLMKVGMVLGGLKMKSNGTVDADSRPFVIKEPPKIVLPPIQQSLI